jgi:hypothetical protein
MDIRRGFLSMGILKNKINLDLMYSTYMLIGLSYKLPIFGFYS